MRKRKWKSRKGAALLALALAFVLGLSGTGLLDTQAAGPVETERQCSLVISAGDLFGEIRDVYEGLPEEHEIDVEEILSKLELSVKLYRVAEIDAGADYTALPVFSGALLGEEGDADRKTFGEKVASVNSETSTEEWQEMALAVARKVESESLEEDESGDLETDSRTVTFKDIDTGLYLVMAGKVDTPYYTYEFTPYLVSLPNNYYASDPENPGAEDSWKYDVTMGLKPGRVERFGSLNIKKNLTGMSLLPGNDDAMFVFRVKIDPLGDLTPAYDKIVAVTFDSGGEKMLDTIWDIPAGATVEVEEVYSGGGYTQASVEPNPAKAIIKADNEPGSTPVTFTFTNEIDGTTTGGFGVVNQFTNEDGSWPCKQIPDKGQTGEVDE